MGRKSQKTAARVAKKHPKIVLVIVILLVLIVAAIAILWYFKPEIFSGLTNSGLTGDSDIDGGSGTTDGQDKEDGGGEDGDDIGTGSESEIAEADFSIHFPQLGNKAAGDCILIDCGETEVLIDAGSQQNSAPVIKKYVDTYCSDGTLEYVISTHADTDHIAAFVGNSSGGDYNGILYKYRIGTFIKFDRTDKSTQIYKNYLTGLEYAKAQGASVFTASQCYYETDGALRQYYLDEGHTLSINILYNTFYENKSGDENNYSVVTLLTKEGEGGDKKHFLFTGDLEKDGEEALVNYYSDPRNSKSEYDILPEVELYKAGHHGSRTSSTQKFIDVIKPKYVVACCVAGSTEYTVENVNTFPTQEMLDHVGKYTDKIYVPLVATGLSELDENGKFASRTFGGYAPLNGNIVFYWSGGQMKLFCSNNYTLLKDTDWFKEYRTWNGI